MIFFIGCHLLDLLQSYLLIHWFMQKHIYWVPTMCLGVGMHDKFSSCSGKSFVEEKESLNK